MVIIECFFILLPRCGDDHGVVVLEFLQEKVEFKLVVKQAFFISARQPPAAVDVDIGKLAVGRAEVDIAL